ncbi:Methionine import ATP-binding protein MetN [bacterium HR15]|nr:Methionine import ATP-binding protein MetN [bacterium HR15]
MGEQGWLHCRVKRAMLDWFRYRWYGVLVVDTPLGELYLPMTGTVAQWFRTDEEVWLQLTPQADPESLSFDAYVLARPYEDGIVPIWPLFQTRYTLERTSPLSAKPLYRYAILAREACLESDFEAIVDLEQYHYASEKELLARWWCPEDHSWQEANMRPRCTRCGRPMRFGDLIDATRASRFLVLRLEHRQPYEPACIGYVRVDPPIPLMHRRLPDGAIQPHIRQAVFPADWFEPPFHVERLLRASYTGRGRSGFEQWWRAQEIALNRCETRVARLARVVVHPDYRADGLGQLALQAMVDWIRERRVPEMRRAKVMVETVAQMTRYNPFMERVGFRYGWETASGRPVLLLPLAPEAEQHLQQFLETDPVAATHGGRLYQPRFQSVEPLEAPIRLHRVWHRYENRVSISRMARPVQTLLRAFHLQRRVIQKTVLKELSLTIYPRQIVVVIGASGAGKTTLLRLIYEAARGITQSPSAVQEGSIEMPANTQVAAYLPCEVEPQFGRATLIETLYRLTHDEVLAVEILNIVGLGDVMVYRSRFHELSTGQRERARIAYLLAQRPNLLIIDEFGAHLDPAMAMRVARKVAQLCREQGITLITATHRQEVIEALQPHLTVMMGYGTYQVMPHAVEPRPSNRADAPAERASQTPPAQ